MQRIEEARSSYDIRRADTFPAIDAAIVYVRFRAPAVLLPGAGLDGDAYQVGLTESNWELDFWSRVHSLKNTALEEFLARDAERRAATISVSGNVADNCQLLRELNERISCHVTRIAQSCTCCFISFAPAAVAQRGAS